MTKSKSGQGTRREKILKQYEASLQLHEDTVDRLVDRLIKTGLYDTIDKHVQYKACGLCGELDVKTTHYINGVRYNHYYEVKSRDTQTARKTAKKQFRRYKFTHKDDAIKGIYVSPTRVQRLR